MWDRKNQQGNDIKPDETPPAQEQDNEKWDKEAAKAGDASGSGEDKMKESNPDDKQGNNGESSENTHHPPPNPPQNRVPCEICGLFNHQTRDCRRLMCEIYGYNNHTTYDCRSCVPWNYGPELCAAQVENQSFFFIDESIDPRVSKDKESIAVIDNIQGQATEAN